MKTNNFKCLGCRKPLPIKINAKWHYVVLLGEPMVGPFCKWTCARAYLKGDFCAHCHKIVNPLNAFAIAVKTIDGIHTGPFCDYKCVRDYRLRRPSKNQFTDALEPNPLGREPLRDNAIN